MHSLIFEMPFKSALMLSHQLFGLKHHRYHQFCAGLAQSFRMSSPSAWIRLKYLSMISMLELLFPITNLSTVHPWNTPGLMNPSYTFLILSPSNFVSSLLGLPSTSQSWKQTRPNSGLLNSLKIPLASTRLVIWAARSTVYLMQARILLRPQCLNKQKNFNELFLRLRPSIQSLQSITFDFPEYWFLQKLKLMSDPMDRVSCFLSPMKRSDPPFPKNRFFEKLTVIESTDQNNFISGLISGQIQLDPKQAASTLIHIPNFLHILSISSLTSFAQLNVLPQVEPYQNGINPLSTSACTISSNFYVSMTRFLAFSQYLAGAARVWKIYLSLNPLWLPTKLNYPKQPTSFTIFQGFSATPTSSILRCLAAWMVTKIDSVVEQLMMDPPQFWIRNF